MESSKKQLLDSKEIIEQINAHFAYWKQGFFVSLIISIVMFVISLPLLYFSSPIYVLFLLPAPFLIIAIVCFIKSGFLGKKKIKFYIKEDVCYSTRIETDDEGVFVYGYHITFNKSGNHKFTGIIQPAEEMYKNAFAGDHFYLVFLKGKKEPLFVIPCKEYEIDKTQFVFKEDKYYPI